MDWNYIGFSLDADKQIKSYQMLENHYTAQYDPGNFFFEQARNALKGAYVPKEEVYCIAYSGKYGDVDARRFIKEMIRDKTLSKAVHLPLRDIAFVYENNPYSHFSSFHIIEDMLKRAQYDTGLKRRLNAYRQYHQNKESDIDSKVITGVKTHQGILLFDDTQRGLQCAEKYLKYVCDNYFSPIYKDADKLQVYYFSTTNVNLVRKAQKCTQMFTLDEKRTFLPQKADFLDSNIVTGYKPNIDCDMYPDLSGYKEILRTLNMKENMSCHNIGILDRFCKTGEIEHLDQDDRFNHLKSFQSLHDQMCNSYLFTSHRTIH